MRLLAFHLSDIHLDSAVDNPIIARASQIIAAAAAITRDIDGVVFIVSGDIAASGKASEYAIASEFFLKLAKATKEQFSEVEAHFLFIPGNHDSDFTVDTKARQLLLESLKEDSFDDSIYEILTSVHGNFFTFVDKQNEGGPSVIGERVCKTVSIKINNHLVCFRLLNSALMSSLDEQQGKLLYPHSVINLDQIPADSKIVISVIHHPYNWLEEGNAKGLREALESSSDFILTGHEHYGIRYRKANLSNSSELDYLEGKVLQDSNDADNSGFFVLFFDTEESLYKSYEFIWKKDENKYSAFDTPKSLPLLRNRQRLQNRFLLDDKFTDELKDPGAQILHPHKNRPSLSDLYVFPDIQQIDIQNDSETLRLVSDSLPEYIRNYKRVVLLGKKSCGKTALSRIMFKDLYDHGFAPILVNGKNIRKATEEHLREVVDRAVKHQYGGTKVEDFHQLPPSQKALIIDDYERIFGTTEARKEIIRIAEHNFEIIILLADEELRFESFLQNELEVLGGWNFSSCQIMEFGHKKRSELIRKWLILGRELELSLAELESKELQYARTLDQLLGNNLIPFLPLFILHILQQLETSIPTNFSLESGSHGHVYEAMLNLSLAKAAQGTNLDVGTLLNYATEMTYSMYKNDSKHISSLELEKWHNDYCSNFAVKLNLKNVLDLLQSALVVFEEEGQIRLRYSYQFYYFVARYLSTHLNDPNIKDHITNLSRRLHNTDSANILLFVSYLSKDEYIIDSVLEAAKKLFSIQDEFDISSHGEFLKNLPIEIPELFLDTSLSAQDRRDALLDDRDRMRPTVKTEAEEDEEKLFDDELAEYQKINLSYKTIQILGQMLRNYAGSLSGERKLQIANETFSLGLRTLRFMFRVIESNKDELIKVLSDFLLETDPTFDRSLLSGAVGGLLFGLAENLSFVVVKHISNSVGHEFLSLTFSSVTEQNKGKSYEVINLSIQMDHYEQFPETDLLRLFKEFRRNPLGERLIRRLTWFYLYLHSTPEWLRQRLAKAAGITIGPKMLNPGVKQLQTGRRSP